MTVVLRDAVAQGHASAHTLALRCRPILVPSRERRYPKSAIRDHHLVADQGNANGRGAPFRLDPSTRHGVPMHAYHPSRQP
jgi:hypothetical protein